MKGDIPPKAISFGGVWSLVRTLLLNRDDRTAEQWNEQFEFGLRKVPQRKLPNRPDLPADRLQQAVEVPDERPAQRQDR